MAIQFNGLSVGNHFVDAQKLSPIHKKSIVTYLSSFFSDIISKNSCCLKLDERSPVMEWSGGVAALPKTPELKQIERIFRFYQNAGLLPKMEVSPQDEKERARASKKSVQEIHSASIPGTNGSLLAGIRIADDTLSLTRNILSSVPTVGAHDPVVRHLGYYAGTIWAFFSLRELDRGIVNSKRAANIGDEEGLRRANALVVSGSLCSLGSAAYLTGRVCDTFSVASRGAAPFAAASALFGLGSVLGAWASFLGGWRCKDFNDKLEAYLDHPNLTQLERFRGALNFLKETIMVTREEEIDIAQKIDADHPGLSADKREKLIEEKRSNLTEVKVKYMKRRTSARSLYLILTQCDQILAKLGDPAKEKEGIREATLLFMEVEQENNTKMSLYILGFIASLIGLAALAIATFFTAGVFPFVLYGISGTVYLATTLYQSGAIFVRRDHEAKKIDLHPVPLSY